MTNEQPGPQDTYDNLPSREFAIEIADAPWWNDLPHGAQEIVRRYAERRLVDSEAIDWKRIEEILTEFGPDYYGMVIREGKYYDFTRVLAALAAAFGGRR